MSEVAAKKPVVDTKLVKVAMNAMQLMQLYGVDPVPESYAVWYHYASGTNGSLKRELDLAIKQNVPFTRAMLLNFYHRFVSLPKEQHALNESTAGAQAALNEALKLISGFGSETKEYNRQLDSNVEHLTNTANDTNRSVQDIVQEIIERAKSMRDSGAALNQKLQESTKEIEVLKTNLEKVSAESQHDFLTGVFNRKALDMFLEAATKDAKDGAYELCALMIDIDHFKQFNDKFGHLIGDEVLKIVARSLTQSVKGKDYVARYGGEEFCVLLPNTPIQGAMIVAEALRKFVSDNNLIRKDTGDKLANITVSIGVARFNPETDNPSTLVGRADEALYRAKKEGRNRVRKEQ